ncbi:hypothetical protein [Pantoea sp. VS1]|uniref:hypothetical protein n=1 Tax=Pantoea sp. VS1 TaxID=2003658 RepID=UPI0015950FEA|nr:hypothetical protein [Pantoea sp. VS1]
MTGVDLNFCTRLSNGKRLETWRGLAIAGALVSNYILTEARTTVTLSEIRSYQNNDDHASLGARFTMWKTGLLVLELHRQAGKRHRTLADFGL